MAILSDYTAGTVTVSAGGTAVTGVGTAWLTAGFQEGDIFIAADWYSLVASVNSNTSLTLYPVGRRGGALSGAPYRLRYMSDGSRSTAQARELINLLGGSGNLQALGGLTGTSGDVPFFTGAGTMSTYPTTIFGRTIQGLQAANGDFIRSTGTGGAVAQAIVGTVSESSGIPTGAIVERGSNTNGDYIRFVGGLQICMRFGAMVDMTISAQQTFSSPASFANNNAVALWGAVANFVSGDVTALRNAFIDHTGSATNNLRWRCDGSGVSTALPINIGAIGFWH